MKTKFKIIITILILGVMLSPVLYSFDTQITGKIIGSTNKPISKVNIELCNSNDSSLVLKTRSDKAGFFRINSNYMNHQVLKFLKKGYYVKYVNLEDFVAKSTAINLGDIKLTKCKRKFNKINRIK